MNELKIVFIGCVQFSYDALTELLTLPLKDRIRITGVITREKSDFNSDFRSLKELAESKGIPVLIASGNDQSSMAKQIRSWSPDVVYCFGWSYLLSQEILNIPRLGVIGYHPTLLPANRGRHPLIWALVLGLSETGSSFFFMGEGADNGDLLHQARLPIAQDDDAASLYRKMTAVALEQIREFTVLLRDDRYRRTPQDHQSANVWRKRGQADGQIDWRMSAHSIYNLIRGLTRPYVGAHFMYQGEEVKVWKSDVAVVEDRRSHIEPGKVLRIEGHILWVKCGEGVIRLTEHGLTNIPKEGAYL
ncbi:formyl transferase [Cohnella pontilimi]|uniref:Formyl transferase n=1 Tax=Cohnella pontilimi TaxID=2564100 RepID=A0A4U0FBA1_9BACL|nr:formyltransferase family protein [Cohnella pontilimi]TJY41961.1 formyl transferase [Cohnella pontilimi]